VVFKGSATNGEVLYGASICRQLDNDEPMTDIEIEAHFKTAKARMVRSPVHFKITDENREGIRPTQMGPGSDGHSTIWYGSSTANGRVPAVEEIVDNIFTRKGGRMQIRGTRKPRGTRGIRGISIY